MSDSELAMLHSGVASYYSERVERYGSTPRGVDWSCIASQYLRFVQLLKLCDFSTPFSLNDVGCGYGALLNYLNMRHSDAEIDYLGTDLSQTMISEANLLWQDHTWVSFASSDEEGNRSADYSIASGIFNVKLDQPTDLWERYIALTLDTINATSRRGFAVNFMLERSSDDDVRDGLYLTRPENWAAYCEQEYGASATVIEDYGQPEFTLLIRPKTANNRES